MTFLTFKNENVEDFNGVYFDRISFNNSKLEDEFKLVSNGESMFPGTPACDLPFAVSLHGGYGFPLSPLSSDYEKDLGFMIDLEYHLNLKWSFVLYAGHYAFKPKSGSGVSDLEIYNISLNAKLYAWIPPNPCNLYYYINGGPGYYFPNIGQNKFGCNVGTGVGKSIAPTLFFEAGADYHKLFDSNYTFIFAHLGLNFRF